MNEYLQALGIGIVILGGATFGLFYGGHKLGEYLDTRRMCRHMKEHGYQTRFDVNEDSGIHISKEPLEDFYPYHWRNILGF